MTKLTPALNPVMTKQDRRKILRVFDFMQQPSECSGHGFSSLASVNVLHQHAHLYLQDRKDSHCAKYCWPDISSKSVYGRANSLKKYVMACWAGAWNQTCNIFLLSCYAPTGGWSQCCQCTWERQHADYIAKTVKVGECSYKIAVLAKPNPYRSIGLRPMADF